MNPTTPKAHRITPDCQPVFDLVTNRCWLHIGPNTWLRLLGQTHREMPGIFDAWHPDQPTAPTSIPSPVSSQEGRTGGLLAEMGEHYAQEQDRQDSEGTGEKPHIIAAAHKPPSTDSASSVHGGTSVSTSPAVSDEDSRHISPEQYRLRLLSKIEAVRDGILPAVVLWRELCDTVAPCPNQPAQEAAERAKRYLDCAEYAWTIIANASGGNWELESKDWQAAAAKWRDESYYPLLDELRHFPAPSPGASGEVREADEFPQLIQMTSGAPTDEELQQFNESTRAYWAWKRATFKGDWRMPLAKLAWDAGVEWRAATPAAPMLPGGTLVDGKDEAGKLSIIGNLNKTNNHRPECQCANCAAQDDAGRDEK